MEEELDIISEHSLEKKSGKKLVEKLLDNITKAVEEASEIRDTEAAKNPTVIMAIQVVEKFLQKSRCVCYGGIAINAHLPDSLKFYDFTKVLPDYDFYSMNPKKDVALLVKMLHDAGLPNIHSNEGLHEGTTKVFVDFVGVADITYMPSFLYNTILENSMILNGIHYVDADFLRMGMYLELSRPRGDVDRWKKVYLRLLYLNKAKPPSFKGCRNKFKNVISKSLHSELCAYFSKHDNIYAGSELQRVYKTPQRKNIKWVFTGNSPVLAFSKNPFMQIEEVGEICNKYYSTRVNIIKYNAIYDIVPPIAVCKAGNTFLCALVGEGACISYNTLDIVEDIQLRVASLDSLIYLYYLLSYVSKLDGILPQTALCFASKLTQISIHTRDRDSTGKYPAFAITCSGHQTSKQSLIRERFERIRSKKRFTRKKKGGN